MISSSRLEHQFKTRHSDSQEVYDRTSSTFSSKECEGEASFLVKMKMDMKVSREPKMRRQSGPLKIMMHSQSEKC